MERDTPLVPQLGTVRLRLEQLLIQLQRRFGILAQNVDLGHRLEHEVLVLALLEGEAIFAQRLREISLLPEGESEIVARETSVTRDLHLASPALLARRDGF